MSFEIRIKKRALKFLSNLKNEKENTERLFLLLKDNPVPAKSLDVSKLKGLKNTYRIRIGKIRIVYEVKWDERMILVHRISFRKDVYSRF